jgi:hypothetical protein
MIKAVCKGPNGNDALFLGLSFGNLDQFRAAPLNSFIRIDGKEIGLPFDVVIFSGHTDAEMTEMMASKIGPDTKVTISERLKQ